MCVCVRVSVVRGGSWGGWGGVSVGWGVGTGELCVGVWRVGVGCGCVVEWVLVGVGGCGWGVLWV